jgi:uncharacterized protein
MVDPLSGAPRPAPPRPAHWPDSGLDVPALRRAGVRPTPFSQFVLKIAARCNLLCDYCYVYNHADTTWRTAPRFMEPDTVRTAAERIARHAQEHDIRTVRISLHGGEPLLAGPERIAGTVGTLRSVLRSVAPSAAVEFTVQTNGTLLDRDWLETLARLDVKVAVSLDGDAATHDLHRRDLRGRPTRAETERGLRLLASDPYRPWYAGLLAVVDPAADPAAFYESLLDFAPPRMDLLLPHATWDRPPTRQAAPGSAEYADWLLRVFELWYAAPVAPTRIRLFESVIGLLLGGHAEGESVGLAPLAYLIIDTDGAYRQSEALNTAYDGCSGTGRDVRGAAPDELFDLPGVAARQIGREALSEQCHACELERICGGGHYGHRYRTGTGFKNPSVYCPDLTLLIRRIADRLAADLAPELVTDNAPNLAPDLTAEFATPSAPSGTRAPDAPSGADGPSGSVSSVETARASARPQSRTSAPPAREVRAVC